MPITHGSFCFATIFHLFVPVNSMLTVFFICPFDNTIELYNFIRIISIQCKQNKYRLVKLYCYWTKPKTFCLLIGRIVLCKKSLW